VVLAASAPYDPEALVIQYLIALGVPAGDELPPELEAVVPWVRVLPLGGEDVDLPWNGSRPLRHRPDLDIDVFDVDTEAAGRLARSVCERLYDLKGHSGPYGRVAAVRCGAPERRPDRNPRVRCYGMVVQLSLRPPAAT
jgi:hypothetical protein